MTMAIIEKRPIGMLLLDASEMKKQMIPSPLRCLDVSCSDSSGSCYSTQWSQ
jgi:hypothetical protein